MASRSSPGKGSCQCRRTLAAPGRIGAGGLAAYRDHEVGVGQQLGGDGFGADAGETDPAFAEDSDDRRMESVQVSKTVAAPERERALAADQHDEKADKKSDGPRDKPSKAKGKPGKER